MIEDKWLTDALFTTVNTKADLRNVKLGVSGDFLSSSLSKVINQPLLNDVAVQAWTERANERKSTLVFCVDVAHVNSLTTAFREKGIDARSIVGKDLIRDRDAILEAFKRREFPVLLNCSIFTEGTDIPNVDCVLLARPTKSRNLLVQMIGRGMRLHAEKENCHIIDLVSSLETGIVSTPTLFGLDPAEIVKEATAEDMKKLRESKQNNVDLSNSMSASTGYPERSTAVLAFKDYDSVQELVEDTSGERHIRAISKLAWVHVDENRYILTSDNGSYLTIEEMPYRNFEVRYTVKLPYKHKIEGKKYSPYAKPRILATMQSLSDAVHSADTFAKKTFVWRLIAVHQKWRQDPATDGQLAFLNNLRDTELKAEDISKGKAGDMITKIKFGARGRFNRIQTDIQKQRKEDRKRLLQRRRLERETVRAGPLSFDGNNATDIEEFESGFARDGCDED